MFAATAVAFAAAAIRATGRGVRKAAVPTLTATAGGGIGGLAVIGYVEWNNNRNTRQDTDIENVKAAVVIASSVASLAQASVVRLEARIAQYESRQQDHLAIYTGDIRDIKGALADMVRELTLQGKALSRMESKFEGRP